VRAILLSFAVVFLAAGCGQLDMMPGGRSGTAAGYSAAGRPAYGIEVKGKKGFVLSPYANNDALIDVRGFPRGTEVTDPWTDKVFLVP
jgi:hypothetical protein